MSLKYSVTKLIKMAAQTNIDNNQTPRKMHNHMRDNNGKLLKIYRNMWHKMCNYITT